MINFIYYKVHALATWYRLDENFPKTFGLYILKIVAHTMLACQSLVSPITYVCSNSFEMRHVGAVQKKRKPTNVSVSIKMRQKKNQLVHV